MVRDFWDLCTGVAISFIPMLRNQILRDLVLQSHQQVQKALGIEHRQVLLKGFRLLRRKLRMINEAFFLEMQVSI